MHIFNVCCAGGGGRLKVKSALHSDVFFKAQTDLLNLELRRNSYPGCWGTMWGAAFLLFLCTGGVGCGIKEWCLFAGKMSSQRTSVGRAYAVTGVDPWLWWYKFWELSLVHVCMNNHGFPFTFAGRWLWNTVVKKQSCLLNILRAFGSVFCECWLRVNETWKNSQYGFALDSHSGNKHTKITLS